MRRVSTIITLALCTLLCVSISSAQQTSTPATTASTPGRPPCTLTGSGSGNNIPVFDSSGCNLVNSLIFQFLGSTSPNLDVSANVNLIPPAGRSYQIGGVPVLAIPGTGNLLVGAGAGTATTGLQNTFAGTNAGFANTTGNSNVFVGFNAGVNSSDPAGGNSYNTFVGTNAGYSATTDSGNTYIGYSAGLAATGTTGNTFTGYRAGRSSQTTGSGNTYYGFNAGYNTSTATVTGGENTYLGFAAGSSGFLISGSENIFVGDNAGAREYNVSDNVEIGNRGRAPEAGTGACILRNPLFPCNNQILIGTVGTQTDTYIVGIDGSAAGTSAPIQTVCVDGFGKLWGTAGTCGSSSRRFKDKIADMGDSSSKLFQLRPVSFFYKPQYDDGTRALQYGLIAEEVAKVYPEMAVYDKDGQPSGVKYQLLAPMLLNELQKEHTVVMAQQDELQTQLQQIKAQRQEIDGLKHELQLQNASLQERLSKLESYVATQVKTASDIQPVTSASPNGGLQ